LLINGLGPLGADFSRQLAREANHRLVLVEATDFPDRELWDEWIANDSGEGRLTARIKRFSELEKQTEVFLLQAELADKTQARALSKEVKERFGALDGVVYIFDDDSSSTTTDEHALLTDKVQGLVALHEALRDEDLSCRLVVSRTRTDSPHSAADSAVRFFVDTFASNSARNDHQHWTSVTWDFAPANGNEMDHTIERLLQLDTPQVVVSDQPLTEGWNKLEALMNASVTKTERQPISTYARPSLRVAYAAPRTPAEQTIAQIWSELLGIEEIGAHDSFLELGGDSLLAVRLISRLRDVFNQNVPLRLIFEASTVAELAKAIEPQGEKDTELAEIMSMLEQLSEEDVERELLNRQQDLTREVTA
jgi:acyl carrier protein